MLALVLCTSVAAQSIVSPGRLRRPLGIFEATAGETTVPCDITPIRPSLNYGFRFQAGYRITSPAREFQGKGHRWVVLTRITPQTGERKPVYLVNGQNLPEIPETRALIQFGGSYLLGEGVYDVNLVLVDNRDRVCRKSWHVDVHRSRAERDVRVAMPASTVWDFSLRGARLLPRDTDDAAGLKLTILLNAAPLFPRRTQLRGSDLGILISTVSSLLERVPARSVRLVVFNLEQQKELYRKSGFLLADVPEVAQAMNGIQLSTVDFQVLQNRKGHLDLLAGLVNQEISAAEPSDVVLFVGGPSRYEDRFPATLLEKAPGRTPQFMGFQILPPMRGAVSATLPDVIHNAISRLGGKTIQVHSPGEFARAIAILEKNAR